MGTFIVLAVLIAIVALILRTMHEDRKKGGGCSGNCGGCSGHCHKY